MKQEKEQHKATEATEQNKISVNAVNLISELDGQIKHANITDYQTARVGEFMANSFAKKNMQLSLFFPNDISPATQDFEVKEYSNFVMPSAECAKLFVIISALLEKQQLIDPLTRQTIEKINKAFKTNDRQKLPRQMVILPITTRELAELYFQKNNIREREFVFISDLLKELSTLIPTATLINGIRISRSILEISNDDKIEIDSNDFYDYYKGNRDSRGKKTTGKKTTGKKTIIFQCKIVLTASFISGYYTNYCPIDVKATLDILTKNKTSEFRTIFWAFVRDYHNFLLAYRIQKINKPKKMSIETIAKNIGKDVTIKQYKATIRKKMEEATTDLIKSGLVKDAKVEKDVFCGYYNYKFLEEEKALITT